MTFAIAGVSGNTGRVAAESLLARGEKVRVIVRDAVKGEAWKERGAEVAVADLGDAAALTRALRGAEGAYLLVPPNYAVPRFRDYQDGISRALAAAVAESGVPHVVLLSSVGAQHERGTGPIAGLHATERLLGEIRGTAISSLRGAYFYENFGTSLGAVKEAGVLPSFFPSGFAFPMVSTGDIGRLAAELLLERPQRSRIVELGSSHSVEEIAAVLAKITGISVRVQEGPLDAMVPALTGAGLTEDLAELYAEMTRAVNSGIVAFEGGHRRVESTEPIEQVFRALIGA
ncbi:MAG TPA: NmrA family NAD(P)-binding protein [Labilithrix sp.]|nr:NmrA family NAD(P)-binding protein [Labilithrix sp.]